MIIRLREGSDAKSAEQGTFFSAWQAQAVALARGRLYGNPF